MNGRNALAPSTLNIFPKLELAPMRMYLRMLAKTLRPSITPPSSTLRSFSSRIRSADSLAMSTAVSTEMPMSAACSAGASLMPSPMNPTTCPLPCSARTIRCLWAGERRAKSVVFSAASASSASVIFSTASPSSMGSGIEPHVAADLAADQVVVAGENLHCPRRGCAAS